MHHPIIEDLLWRYTTKKYDNTRKVPQEDMDVFLEALRLSASSINSQQWKFVVLASDEAKARMQQSFGDSPSLNKQHVMDGSHVILFGNHPRYSREDYAEVVDQGIADKRTRRKIGMPPLAHVCISIKTPTVMAPHPAGPEPRPISPWATRCTFWRA